MTPNSSYALSALEQWRNRAATNCEWNRGKEVDELGRIIDDLARATGSDTSVAGKRNAEGYLCYAWGETDLPVALFAADRSGVFRFFVCEWFGDPKDPGLPAAMEQLDSHNFREGPLEWKFEIGGVRIERVYGYEALTTPPAAQAQDAEPMAMHLREAFQEWRAGAIDSLRLNDAWDVIWNRARALAAKEAK